MAPIWGHRPSAERGRAGETLAKQLLKQKGYRILAENFLCREGEIDLIAEHRRAIIFIEVKLRRSTTFGTAAEAITREKLRRLQAAAGRWRQCTRDWRPYRFEVVAIDETENGTWIEHLTAL